MLKQIKRILGLVLSGSVLLTSLATPVLADESYAVEAAETLEGLPEPYADQSETANGLPKYAPDANEIEAQYDEPEYLGGDAEETVSLASTLYYTYGPLTYTITSSNEITITDCETSATSVDIPSEIDGIPVTSIGDSAFDDCSRLINLSMSDNVRYIGDSAFSRCKSLVNINLSDNTEYIGSWAFSMCGSLKEIFINESVTKIGESAFAECYVLKNITVSDNNEFYLSRDGVLFDKEMDSLICYPAGKIGEYVIPNGVKNIESYAFSVSVGLTNVIIPDSVKIIRDGAFYYCNSLSNITIPDSVVIIESGAFSGCSGLELIIIPKNVSTIGEYAFMDCDNLTKITIPDSVVSIGEFAFAGCDNLIEIEVSKGNSVYSSCNGALFDKNMTNLISCPGGIQGEYIIPDSVINIKSGAFVDCPKLTSVITSNNLICIEDYAFNYCYDLVNITIFDSVTNIGEYAFESCNNLIIYGHKDSYAQKYAEINNMTFIELARTYENLIYEINDDNTISIIDCDTSVVAVNIPEAINDIPVTEIASYAFSECTDLNNVIIPDSISSIGIMAFANCTSITSIVIPDSVTIINNDTFYNCLRLSYVSIGNGVISIGRDAFSNCANLSEIEVKYKNNIYYSQDGVLFSKETNKLIKYPPDKSDKVYSVPSGVTSIDIQAFSKCNNLLEVYIPDSVKEIGSAAFRKCSVLQNVVLPNSIRIISERTFDGCSSLSHITIPDTVENIGIYAFSNSGLKSLTIPNSTSEIQFGAFNNCTELKNIIIPDSVVNIGMYAFQYCDDLTISGYTGSYAEIYAQEHNIQFCAILWKINYDSANRTITVSALEEVLQGNKCCLYIAKYDVDANLSDFEKIEFMTEEDKMEYIYNLQGLDEGEKVKIMLWDENMQPLSIVKII